VMTICIIHAQLGNYLVSHSYNPHFWKWKHTKVECIILSQLVGLSIMNHGTKYKWIIFLNDSKKYYYMWYDHIIWISWIDLSYHNILDFWNATSPTSQSILYNYGFNIY
jgi:hypothetical protein